jgi:hypothetical protein
VEHDLGDHLVAGHDVLDDLDEAGPHGQVVAGHDDLDVDGPMLDTIEKELADVERALAMLDEGTYGQCEACGRAVEDAVLARAPTVRFCSEHLPLTLR